MNLCGAARGHVECRTVKAPPLRCALRFGLLVVSILVPACGGGDDGAAVPAPPSSIEVTPTVPSAAQGTSRPLAATGLFSGSTTLDLTAAVTWSSSDELVATVSNGPGSRGLATAVAPGTATLTATYAGVSGSTLLTVTAAALVSLDITPTTPSIARGTTRQFLATGSFSDGSTQDLTSTAVWSSSSDPVATVTQGLATGVSPGLVIVTATFGVESDSTSLTSFSTSLPRAFRT